MTDFDVAIIGGGLNGVAIARDAAGRGLRVALFEQHDLGSSGSQGSPHLIHGGFMDLERRQFFHVRRALRERDMMLQTAPHLVRPMRFILPAHSEERPLAMLRMGLYVYERLASDSPLPRPEALDLTIHTTGHPLKRSLRTACAYSDCLVDESRLVVLKARDAAERGAVIWTGARCARADRSDIWKLAVINRGHREIVTARALVTATGAWTSTVAETVLHVPAVPVRITRISQIIVKRLFEGDHVYVFQNDDQRVIHAIPFHEDFTLIGTSAQAFKGDPAIVSATSADIGYLCKVAGRYFRERLEPADVIHAMAGPDVANDRGSHLSDGFTKLDRKYGEAPLLTVFGGDTTTARRRAEQAVTQLAPFFVAEPPWTLTSPLPGGDFSWDDYDDLVENTRQRWPFLTERHGRRLVAAYGTRVGDILDGVGQPNDLGPVFGEDLTGAEVRYLMAKEWARFSDDVLWRRSKLGLSMSVPDREALAKFMAAA
ncbi:glycerol-3-phosphate dehydrogenase [Bradyrhizobium sp. SYSU BS000235]|uniref:glycerol-3-phosphate dehydrogenase n=1 Tax=Bradyrhizobium sp. SYSU BS000235 TaxID=3411332 RepID=UPI003C77BFEC